MMEKRTLGRTGLSITPIGFGGMELQHCNNKEAQSLLNTVLDLGINYIDTSPEYPVSEYYIGAHLSKRRHEYILATKCGDNLYDEGPAYQFDRKTCQRNLEDSLRLMKTDYIDVWQLHAVVPSCIAGGMQDDVISYMLDMKAQGKVRFLGATIRNGRGTEEGYPDQFGYDSLGVFSQWNMLDVIQVVYGGLTRKSENAITSAASKGQGIIARGVLKNYKPWYSEAFEKSGVLSLLDDTASKQEFLIRYALSHPNLSSMVIGTKSAEHFAQDVSYAKKGAYSPERRIAIQQRLDSAGFIAMP